MTGFVNKHFCHLEVSPYGESSSFVMRGGVFIVVYIDSNIASFNELRCLRSTLVRMKSKLLRY